MRTPSLTVLAVALLGVGLLGVSLGASARASAQARDLGSPWVGGARSAAPIQDDGLGDEGLTDDGLANGAAGTPSDDDEAVPPPPGAYGADGRGEVRVAQPGDLPTVEGVTPSAAAVGDAVVPPPGAEAGWVPAEPGSTLQLRSSISTRLRALDADLQVLAARGGGSIVDGVLAIVMGATSVGIGLFMDLSGTAPASGMTAYLYVYGGSGIVRGVLDFLFLRNPSGVAITYAHMPMADLGEVRTRLRFGERELESLAQSAEISRILDGALSIGTGLAVIPVYLGPTNFSFTNAFDYFVLIGAAVSATTGIITLFSTNEAERRWSAYRELRDRLLATEQGAADDAELEQAAEQLEAFERSAAGAEFHPILAASQGGFFAGATGSF